MTNQFAPSCPLANADRRLCDGLKLWVETRNMYFHPDRFRLSLNNTIQTLRNITFVLQSAKNSVGANRFDQWYIYWQEEMRSDPKMKWLIESRNIIVKQGDLETYSKARMSIITSWDEPSSVEFDVNLFDEAISKGVIDKLSHADLDSEVALLKFERRWVDSRLPEEEILEVLAHGFRVLSRIVFDAHVSLLNEVDQNNCDWFGVAMPSGGEIPPCMFGQQWDRTVWFDMKKNFSIVKVSMMSGDEVLNGLDGDEIIKRYPNSPIMSNRLKATSLEEKAVVLFEQAKYLLQVDGGHVPIAFLVYSNGTTTIVELNMEDRSEKHLVYRKIAEHVEKTGPVELYMINECWVSSLCDMPPKCYPVDDPNKKEGLSLVAINIAGDYVSHTALFDKDENGRIVIGKENISRSDVMNALKPIRDAWERRKNM